METTEVATVQETQPASPAEITAPSAVTPTPPAVVREIAYLLQDDHFDDFPIYQSANAWWVVHPRKVQLLIEAFKQGHLVTTACFYAGISRGKWEYFNEVHPEFSGLIEDIKNQPVYLKAMNSMVGGLDKDPRLSMSLLRARHPDFKTKDKVDPTPAPVQQSVNVQVNTHVDTAKIEDILARAAERFVTDGPRESSLSADSGQGVAEGSQS